MRGQALIAAFLLIPAAAHAAGDAKTHRSDHVVVSYSGIGEEYAKAVAATVEAARAVAAEQFGSDMPNEITVTVRSDPGARVRLFNDGQDQFELTVRSEKDLLRPARSGIFHLYGLCHEVGHLAMYRVIRDHSWMTTAGAEGWAHYLGSRIVDGVYAREGDGLWPDAYDYRADGMKRLRQQLAAKDPSPIVRGASLWKEFAEIVGDKGVAPIFSAWGKAKIDPADPRAALRKALLAANKDKRLAAWWDKAEPIMVLKCPKSGFADRKAKPGDLTGEPIEHARDDGAAAGATSIAGSAHAVRFNVQGDGWCLTGVRIHGSRYGHPRPPREDFHVWLCDKDHKAVADFPFPYATFARGPAEWVTLKIPPTRVPPEFIVCVGFNPTGTKGVGVSYDKEGSGKSLTGLPGRAGGVFHRGDWLIRVRVDQLKAADPLRRPPALRRGSAPADKSAERIAELNSVCRQKERAARELIQAAHAALDRSEYELAVRTHKKARQAQAEAATDRLAFEQELQAFLSARLKELDDDSYHVRERATERLLKLGPWLAPFLRKALAGTSLEVRARLSAVLARLDDMAVDEQGRLHQWARDASASSQYGPVLWSARQATGKPDTPKAGDCDTAWATAEPTGGTEWLELTYRVAVHPVTVRVRETFNPGAVVEVEARDTGGNWHKLWEGKDATTECPGWLEIAISRPVWACRVIRLHLDTSTVVGWNEIDAVELVGEMAAENSTAKTAPQTRPSRADKPAGRPDLPAGRLRGLR